MRIPEMQCGVGYPDLSGRERFLQIVDQIFENAWLTNNGPVVAEFERQLQAVTGARHCIAVCNATTGLMVALRALDVSGRVAVPAFTFPATVHAIEWLGLEPVLCDVDAVSHGIDVDSIDGDVDAIVGVHIWGRACDVSAVEAFARQRSIPALFDAAPALGARLAGTSVGSFGRCEVFSFHATKIVNSIEGGAITTNDGELAARIRQMVNFGFEGRDRVVSVGINAKLSEVHAAMGVASLELLDRSLAHNRRNLRLYSEALEGLDGIRLVSPTQPAGSSANGQYVVVEIGADSAVTRDGLIAHLRSVGIDARRYFYPGNHRNEPYASRYPAYVDALPVTDRLCAAVMQLPAGAATSPADVEYVGESVRKAFLLRHNVAYG